jgi:hypothetical protein
LGAVEIDFNVKKHSECQLRENSIASGAAASKGFARPRRTNLGCWASCAEGEPADNSAPAEITALAPAVAARSRLTPLRRRRDAGRSFLETTQLL